MKKFLVLMLALLLCLVLFTCPISATTDLSMDSDINILSGSETFSTPIMIQTIYSGGCGDDGDTTTASNVTWALDTSTGVLIISGSGNMVDYASSTSQPYYPYKSSITNVIIESGVTSIGNNAFYSYAGLSSLTIGENVTSIGDYAFYNCTNIDSLTIPGSVTHIGYYAFNNITQLSDIHWAAINVNDFTSTSNVFSGCGISTTGITVLFGDNVESIPAYVFYSNSKIKSLTIGENVTSIGSHAFSNGTGLTSLTIPNSVTSIGNYAFSQCYGLDSLTIGENVISIGSHAFSICTKLTSLTIPNSVTSIGDYAFQDCTELDSLTIGENVTSIGGSAFSSCTELTSLTIPNSVTSIGVAAFRSCIKLTSLTIGENVTSIGGSAFSSCTELTSLTIPNSVTSIGAAAFYNLTNLTAIQWNAPEIPDFSATSNVFYCAGEDGSGISVTFGDNVTSIPAYLFYTESVYDSPSITSLTIGSNVKTIGEYAFYYNGSLSSLTIPDSVETIEDYAFHNYSKVTTLTLGRNLKSIGAFAFDSYGKLTTINWNAVNVTNVDVDAFVSDGSTTTGITVIYGDSVEVIPSAFRISPDSSGHYPIIRSITLGENITTIHNYAFYSTLRVSSLTIPDSVTTIGGQAFGQCTISNLTLGKNITTIGTSAFYNISAQSVNWNCTNVTNCGRNIFNTNNGGYVDLTIGDNVESIPDYAFYFFTGVNHVTIGNNVASIGEYAFYNLPYLQSAVIIPFATTSIGTNAFHCGSGFNLRGYIGSYAQTYAQQNQITFYNIGYKYFDITYFDDTIELLLEPEQYAYSVGASVLPTPTKSDYNFSGWYSNDEFTGDSITSLSSTQTGDITLYAKWIPLHCTFNVNSGDGGNISPGTTTINYGEEQTFDITPDSGYKIKDVLVDEVSQGAITEYTFTNVTTNHTISATFEHLSYNITVNAGNGGGISPSSATVNYGSNQTFTITPNTGYKVKDVKVDGISKGALSTFTFTNVTTNHTISATFEHLGYNITVNAGNGGGISPSSATVNYGSNQTFTITPNTGYEIKDVLVDGASVGAVSSYTFSNVTAAHTLSATFKQKNTQAFNDIPNNIWYKDSVNDLVSKGILNGYKNSNGTYSFKPDNTITRAEFATILAKASGEDLSNYKNKTSFNDVSTSFWGAKYIEWAYQNNIVKGKDGGKYDPDANISRQEMAVMIYRFATVYQGTALPGNNAALSFTDQSSIATWAKEAVTAMQRAGIINGIKNSNGSYHFDPSGNATRAQAAKMISKYLEL